MIQIKFRVRGQLELEETHRCHVGVLCRWAPPGCLQPPSVRFDLCLVQISFTAPHNCGKTMPFQELPTELLIHILCRLDAISAVKLCLVRDYFSEIDWLHQSGLAVMQTHIRGCTKPWGPVFHTARRLRDGGWRKTWRARERTSSPFAKLRASLAFPNSFWMLGNPGRAVLHTEPP